MSDEEILQRIAGDPAGGLAIAIDKYGRQLNGRLNSRAIDRGYGNVNVEDVWQECFFALLDPVKRGTLVSRETPEILPWLTKRGYWGLQHRHDRRSAPLDPEAAVVTDPNGESDLVQDTKLEPSDATEALQQSWSGLSDRDKLMLTWRYGESQSELEIAAELGLTYSAVKKALHDARRRLKRAMTDLGYEP